jgi:hypothetical protein
MIPNYYKAWNRIGFHRIWTLNISASLTEIFPYLSAFLGYGEYS